MRKQYGNESVLKSTIVIAAAGLLIAMNFLLTRFVAIPIGGDYRITFGTTPIYLASLWFGPIVGGICGGIGDLIGCILSGYAPNPIILLASILAGVIPAVMARYVFRSKMVFWKILVAIAVQGVIGSIILRTIGVALMYGTPWVPLLIGRIIQTVLLTIVNSILVSLLYESRLTAYVEQNFYNIRVQNTIRKSNQKEIA